MNGKINIPIKAEVFHEMIEYAAWADHFQGSEIAGWGFYNSEDGIYGLAPLTQQNVGAATADTIPDELLKNPKINLEEMIVQWHSHVRMSPIPSDVDIANRKDIVKMSGILISIIVNLNMEYSCKLSIQRANGITFSEPIEVDAKLDLYYSNEKIADEVEKKLVEHKPIQHQAYPPHGYDGLAGMSMGFPGVGENDYISPDESEIKFEYDEILEEYGFKYKGVIREINRDVHEYQFSKKIKCRLYDPIMADTYPYLILEVNNISTYYYSGDKKRFIEKLKSLKLKPKKQAIKR